MISWNSIYDKTLQKIEGNVGRGKFKCFEINEKAPELWLLTSAFCFLNQCTFTTPGAAKHYAESVLSRLLKYFNKDELKEDFVDPAGSQAPNKGTMTPGGASLITGSMLEQGHDNEKGGERT
jgi:hypothetical protein